MRLFEYEAADPKSGELRRGTRRAVDEDEIVQHIRARELNVTDIKPTSAMREWYDALPFRRPSRKLLRAFFRDFAIQVGAGTTDFKKIFTSIARSTRNKRFREAIDAVGFEATASITIADAMERWPFVFDDVMVALTRAGQDSGNLAATSHELREILEERMDFASDLAEATMEAKISAASVVALFVYVTVGALPQLVQAFGSNGNAIPPIILGAQSLVSIVASPLVFIPLVLVAIVAFFPSWVEALPFMRTDTVRLARGWWSIHQPIFGAINRKNAMSMFARTFGTLMSHGTDPNDALRLSTPAAGNTVYVRALHEIYDAFVRGVALSVLLRRTKLFDDNFLQPLEAAEEAGLDMPERLVLIGHELRKEGQRELKRVAKPIGFLFQGAVALLVLGISVGIGVLAYQTYTSQAVSP